MCCRWSIATGERRAAGTAGAAAGDRVPRCEAEEGDGVLYEAVWENDFCQALLDAIVRRRRFKGALGELVGVPARALRRLRGPLDTALPATLLKAEQSNTSIVYGEQLILKVFRHLDEGMNPDLELSRFLTERAVVSAHGPVGWGIGVSTASGRDDGPWPSCMASCPIRVMPGATPWIRSVATAKPRSRNRRRRSLPFLPLTY